MYICIQWRTPIMPAPAFNYFHTACWKAHRHRVGEKQALSSVERLRYGHTSKISPSATCSECGEHFR